MKGNIPTEVLSQRISEVIGGRRLRVGLFTTFTFDPGFFELHVLPIFFDQTFSQVDKIRRIQLEDALRSVDHLAVYYDRSALAQDAEPAQLDYRRIDVKRTTGCFHPKVILLLVDNSPEDVSDVETKQRRTHQSLIIALMSANLTRAGWWENVECAHLEEIHDKEVLDDRSAFRHDILSLIRRIYESTYPGEEHSALEQIRQFLLNRTPTERFSKTITKGRYRTRLFCGQNQMSLSQWFSDLRLSRREWNLEIISPYFDQSGAGPLTDLIDTLGPNEVRVYLPRDIDGSALVTETTYHEVVRQAYWGNLPTEMVQSGQGKSSDKLPPRRVHAKVYRLWNRQGSDLLLIGSVNLTSSAHSHGGAGNLEAAFLVDVTNEGYPRRWWLERVDIDKARFAERAPAEEDGLDQVPIDLSFRYDWGTGKLSYRLMANDRAAFEIAETSGRSLFRIATPRTGRWIDCHDDEATQVRELLKSSSFLLVRHEKGQWRVLIREENMGYRPSLLTQLTPEEILEYWALLTPEQRAAFIEHRVGVGLELEGISLGKDRILYPRNTMFDRFAGIYHSFGCLRRYVDDAIKEGRHRDAESRLMGAKYDSLPSLLQKTFDRVSADPIICYITFLCARQLRDGLAKQQREFFRSRRDQVNHLDTLLDQLTELRKQLGDDHGIRDFLEWYEPLFLKELGPDGSNG